MLSRSNVLMLALTALLLLAGVVLARHSSPYPEVNNIAVGVKTLEELQTRFSDLAKAKGAPYAFEILKGVELTGEFDIHLLAHSVGDILYKQQGIGGMALCTDDFRNACSHAVVIGAMLEHGEDILPQVHEACLRAPGGANAYSMCYHGFGHGVFTYFDDDLEKTVAYCQKTGTPEREHQEYGDCIGGAVMELMGTGGHNPAELEKARKKYLTGPLEPCMSDIIPKEGEVSCLMYLTPWLWESAGQLRGNLFTKPFTDAFRFCDDIPKSLQELRSTCFAGFGKEFVVLAAGQDIRAVTSLQEAQLRQIGAWCAEAMIPAGIRACVAGAVDSMMWSGTGNTQIAFDYCAILPSEASSACLKRLGNNIRRFFAEPRERQKWCQKLPENYQQSCAT